MEIGTKVRVNNLPAFQRYTLSKGEEGVRNEWYVGGFIEAFKGVPGTVYLCREVGQAYLVGRGMSQADIVLDDHFVEVL